jgi:hypothetical protein
VPANDDSRLVSNLWGEPETPKCRENLSIVSSVVSMTLRGECCRPGQYWYNGYKMVVSAPPLSCVNEAINARICIDAVGAFSVSANGMRGVKHSSASRGAVHLKHRRQHIDHGISMLLCMRDGHHLEGSVVSLLCLRSRAT